MVFQYFMFLLIVFWSFWDFKKESYWSVNAHPFHIAVRKFKKYDYSKFKNMFSHVYLFFEHIFIPRFIYLLNLYLIYMFMYGLTYMCIHLSIFVNIYVYTYVYLFVCHIRFIHMFIYLVTYIYIHIFTYLVNMHFHTSIHLFV